jgi:hypothetical protein
VARARRQSEVEPGERRGEQADRETQRHFGHQHRRKDRLVTEVLEPEPVGIENNPGKPGEDGGERHGDNDQ